MFSLAQDTNHRRVTMLAEDHEFSMVEDILEEAAKYGHTILYLNYKGLKSLPLELLQPPIADTVERLYLKRNLLKSLPSNIGQLTRLVELYVHSNSLEQLPDEISNMVCLESLDVSCNNLQCITPKIGDVPTLKKLHLSNNDLVRIPPEIGKLKQLVNLEIINNKLMSIPNEICQCQSLKSLTLDRNKLRELPRHLMEMHNLQEISVTGNKLTHLPADLGMMPSLKSIYVDNNPALFAVPFSLWSKEIGTNSCGTADIHRTAGETRLLVEVDGYSALLPPEIKKFSILQDPTKHKVQCLLELCLRAVHYYSNSQAALLRVEESDLPQYLLDLVLTPTAHCLAPSACEKPIFTSAYARLLKLAWAQPWQNQPGSIPFLGLCCSRECLELFTRFPVPV
ncbi:leucine-rich repeat-containing protein 28-like isoform X2 [Ptychodera flava]